MEKAPQQSPPRPSYRKMSKQPSQRLPAPSLFVGPPSHNASNTSLSKPTSNTSQPSKTAVPSASIPGPSSPALPQHNSSASIPLSRQNTSTNNNTNRNLPSSAHQNNADGAGVGVGESAEAATRKTRPRRGTAVLDAHWAALQSTLSDIELSAGSSAHVFGEGHAKALEELRAAQVELARAWGQTDEQDTPSALSHTTTNESQNSKEEKKEGKKDAERKLSNTPADLSDAAKRRDASDKYFLRVKDGVQEVVRKLDGVSDAMRAVEMQSRDIWGEAGSATTDSMSTLST